MSITVTVDGGVAQILLNKPERRNALDLPMIRALAEALDDLKGSEATALVLGATGKSFCVGADLDALTGTENPAELQLEAVEQYLRRVRALPMPVIVAVEGAAAGGGASLALSGDLRVLGRSAKLYGSTFALGMTPDAGMSYFLSRAVGSARAVNLMLRNTPMDAEFLAGVGLADVVVEDGTALAEARKLAAELGPRTAPLALLGLRQLMDAAPGNSLDQQLEQEAHWVRKLNATEDFQEGVAAFLERRPPVFHGR